MRRTSARRCSVAGSMLFLAALVATAAAQMPSPPDRDAKLGAMRELDFLVGDWRGSGWMQMGPQMRIDFKSREIVERKLGGMIVAIEGIHEGVPPGSTDSVTVHHAFAVLSYDAQAKKYRFRSWLENGLAGDYEATVNAGTLEWGYEDPRRGRIRYIIRLDDKGQWQETGDFSKDGTTWMPFFAMTLSRAAPGVAAPPGAPSR